MKVILSDLALIGLVLVVSTLTQVQSQPAADPASCADIRKPGDPQITCDKRAYRAWLSAGLESSQLAKSCREDLLQLPKQCNMTEYLEEGLKLSELKVDRPLMGKLKDFVNVHFIDLYREAHPNEPALHLGTRGEQKDCCKSDDGPAAVMTNNLLKAHVSTSLVGDSDTAPSDELLLRIGEVLGEHILKPCGRYLHVMDKLLFGQLQGSVRKFMADDWSFLSRQTDEFRQAVFRYQWCSKDSLNARIWDDDDDYVYEYHSDSEDMSTDGEMNAPV